MPNRIIITYSCAHAAPKIQPVVVKDWDSTLPPGRVCWCQNDPEKNIPMATPMNWTVKVEQSKPE